MGRTYIHAPPGPGQTSRIIRVRSMATAAGHFVRRYPAPGKAAGWLVLVVWGPLPGRAMRDEYSALDYLGLLD